MGKKTERRKPEAEILSERKRRIDGGTLWKWKIFSDEPGISLNAEADADAACRLRKLVPSVFTTRRGSSMYNEVREGC